MRWLGLVWLWVACAPAEPQVAAQRQERATADLRDVLRARHVEDLPDRQALSRRPHAESELITLALRDPEALVRIRALDRLGMFPTDRARDTLLAVADDARVPVTVRAAAVGALRRQPLERLPDVRAHLTRWVRGADPRLAAEAVEVVVRSPAMTQELAALRAEVGLSDRVRVRLQGVSQATP